MGPTRHCLFAVFLLLCLILVMPDAHAQDDAPAPLNILRISPEGFDATATRQIVIEFNRPVVSLGKMERTAEEVGVTISPTVNCQWRWLNRSALACNLAEKESLTPATKYDITVSPLLKAQDGAMIEDPYKHSFTTQRPSAYFYLHKNA